MADKKYEEHMMYGDGKARKAETHAEHLELKNKGWGHKKPSGFKMKGYTYPGTSPLKACWKGYEMIGTKKKGGRTVPNCVPKKKK